MRFADPLYLLLLVLVPLAVWWWWRSGGRASLRFSSLQWLTRQPDEPGRARIRPVTTAKPVGRPHPPAPDAEPGSPAPRRRRPHAGGWVYRLRWAVPALRGSALVLAIVALARPQQGTERSRVIAEGIAIGMVVDTSSSMSTKDFREGGQFINRLEAVKKVFREFVAGGKVLVGRPNDLISMVTFANYPDVKVPLTLEHHTLLAHLQQTHTVRVRTEDGTAIGEAVVWAAEHLKKAENVKSKVMILLTDGVQNAGTISAVKAANIAATLGIKIYAIGAGGGTERVWGGFSYMLRRAEAPIDEQTLKEVAKISKGKYFRATDLQQLRNVYAEIDKLEKTKTETFVYQEFDDRFLALAMAALGCLCLEQLLIGSRFRRIP